jgi:hypothetical protein
LGKRREQGHHAGGIWRLRRGAAESADRVCIRILHLRVIFVLINVFARLLDLSDLFTFPPSRATTQKLS